MELEYFYIDDKLIAYVVFAIAIYMCVKVIYAGNNKKKK